ncbi:hypothetical protein Ciccas_003616 [Cichlidogyrus casuarinus]|uniref:Uncharacterized protein n=1 Tax=Cichlidogyrus casuarinus TaxID=1844966 RepID=A0ABD2QDV0_9PLAT
MSSARQLRALSYPQGRITFETYLIALETDDSEEETQIFQDESGNKYVIHVCTENMGRNWQF